MGERSNDGGRGRRAAEVPRVRARISKLARIRWFIARIPRGRVATYGQLAALAGYPRAARLTVRALQRSDGLPWHRVIAAGGRIALPGAEGTEQRLRLEMEGVTFHGERVRIERHRWAPRSHYRVRPAARRRPFR